MYLNFSNFRGQTSAGGGQALVQKRGQVLDGGDWQNFRRMGGPPVPPQEKKTLAYYRCVIGKAPNIPNLSSMTDKALHRAVQEIWDLQSISVYQTHVGPGRVQIHNFQASTHKATVLPTNIKQLCSPQHLFHLVIYLLLCLRLHHLEQTGQLLAVFVLHQL